MNTTELLKILVCPKCHSELTLKETATDKKGFFCQTCRVIYPIMQDIPIMLPDEALTEEEFYSQSKA